MGSSGCGKSTLLNVLSGRANQGECIGKIFVNGKQYSSLAAFKELVGFVPQDDICFEDLTVFENLMFSALLRLPREWSFEEKQNLVHQCLHVLDLSSISNSRIGSAESRGISGGQRKRVSIGMELCALPSILLLDEPTSGLDSTSALKLIQSLRAMAENGMTVAAVIHQPRFSVLQAFDNMLLLSLGKTAYFGSVDNSLTYFSTLGKQCPRFENPADFFLDILSEENNDRFADQWSVVFNLSAFEQAVSQQQALEEIKARTLPSIHTQFYVQLARSARLVLYRYREFALDLALVVLASAAVGMVYGSSWKLHHFVSISSLSCLALGVSSVVSCLKTLSVGRSVYWRETSSGTSIVSMFYAKMVLQLYQVFLFTLVFASILHASISPEIRFRTYFLILVAVSWCTSGLGLFFGALLEDNALLACVLLIVILGGFFSGTYPTLASMSLLMRAISFMSYGRWSTEALLILETQALPQHIDTSGLFSTGFHRNNLYEDIVALVTWGLFWRFMVLIALRFKRRNFDWVRWLREIKSWVIVPIGLVGVFIPSAVYACSLHGLIDPIEPLSKRFWLTLCPLLAPALMYLLFMCLVHYVAFSSKHLSPESHELTLLSLDLVFSSRIWILFQAFGDLAALSSFVLLICKAADLIEMDFHVMLIPAIFALAIKIFGLFIRAYQQIRQPLVDYLYILLLGACAVSLAVIDVTLIVTPFGFLAVYVLYDSFGDSMALWKKILFLIPLFVSASVISAQVDFGVSNRMVLFCVFTSGLGFYAALFALFLLYSFAFLCNSVFSLFFCGLGTSTLQTIS
jgi:ABC-type multidrug transport system ATPase subunit